MLDLASDWDAKERARRAAQRAADRKAVEAAKTRTLTRREQEIYDKTQRILSYAFRGMHHVQTSRANGRFGPHNVDGNLAEVIVWARGGLSTWDYDELTRLVVASHFECVRFVVLPSGPGLLKLRFSGRRPFADTSDPMMLGHPTIYESIAVYEDPVTWADVVGVEP